MNKKIIIPLVVVIVAAGLIFFVAGRREAPEPTVEVREQLIKESISILHEELRLIREALLSGQISQEQADEKLTAIENKVAELITQHGIKADVERIISRYKTVDEIRAQIAAVNLELIAIAEINRELSEPLAEELRDIAGALGKGQISQEQAVEKLFALEDKAAELVAQHNIKAEVDEFVSRHKAVDELMQWVEPRTMVIRHQFDVIAKIDMELLELLEISLGEEFWFFEEELFLGEISREEANEKLTAFEEKIDEFIAQHGIKSEVDEQTAYFEAGGQWLREVAPRLDAIERYLTAIEVYLSE